MLSLVAVFMVSIVIGYGMGYIDRGTRIDSRLDFEKLKLGELKNKLDRIGG